MENEIRFHMRQAGYLVNDDTDLGALVGKLVAEAQENRTAICRLRGETEFDKDLKRFVDYCDHTMNLSPGMFSSVIDFAQGQKVRADKAEAALAKRRDDAEGRQE